MTFLLWLQEAPAVGVSWLTVFQLLGSLLSGVSLVVIVSTAFKFGTWSGTINAKLDALKDLPIRVVALEREMAVLKHDVNKLWEAFRDYTEENQDDENRYIRFLHEWDKKHAGGSQ